MKNLYAIIIFVFLILLSCKKEQPATMQEPTPPWKKFVGTYQVFDTTGVYMHDMEISHFATENQHGVVVDSLRLDNFNGMFDLRTQFHISNIENFLSIGLYNGIRDHDGKRWLFTSWWDFEETPEIENQLVNDTIVFGFEMTNIAYYIHDVTPYYECRCRIVAVKQD